jgi:5-methylcytosine-specific restriction protein A
MPMLPKRPCREPGCANLSDGVSCDAHRGNYLRDSAAVRGYDRRWQAARARYLRVHPLCMECGYNGRVVVATIVDHIKPHRGDKRLFWDEGNWQPMCKSCHNRKTGEGL